MTTLTPLQQALLELELEDLIPLPEAFGDQDVRAAAGGEPALEDIAAAIIGLAQPGRISVWAGARLHEPRRVDRQEAEQLLHDPRRYAFENEATGLKRVYLVNVENVP
ncbi:MAG: hypothetical protein M3Y35_05600 [Actinomycetota bacterium]|nr:hypothetical protein [Actinomycetota bacterium]